MGASRLRLILMLVAAGVVSVLAGLAINWLAALMPCQGERLACNIDQAVGAYAAMIWAALGPLIFGVTLLVAQNRTALAGAAIMLLSPLLVFFGLTTFNSWRYGGFFPYEELRTFLVALAPPMIAVLAQWLVLGFVIRPGRPSAPKKTEGAGAGKGEESKPKEGSILFPTE